MEVSIFKSLLIFMAVLMAMPLLSEGKPPKDKKPNPKPEQEKPPEKEPPEIIPSDEKEKGEERMLGVPLNPIGKLQEYFATLHEDTDIQLETLHEKIITFFEHIGDMINFYCKPVSFSPFDNPHQHYQTEDNFADFFHNIKFENLPPLHIHDHRMY